MDGFESTIAGPFHGDAALTAELHTAYGPPVENHLKAVSVALGVELIDLYQDNHAVIPRWAFPAGFTSLVPRRLAEFTTLFIDAAERWNDPTKPATPADVDRELNDWYRHINDDLGYVTAFRADNGQGAAWSGRLQAAYTPAVRALLNRAAATQGRPVFDLYQENRGRIPAWAWEIPHTMVGWTTSPLPEGTLTTYDAAGAPTVASFELVPGVFVEVRPDEIGPTEASWVGGTSGFGLRFDDHPKRGRPTVTVLLRNHLEVTSDMRTGDVPVPPETGYGRGTTAADLAGAEVIPFSRSVNFHEGQHAMDAMDFIRQNPTPQFAGPEHEVFDPELYQRYLDLWHSQWGEYTHRISRYTTARTHCVGITSDQYHQKKGTGHPDECR